jgi:hypothetical protein
MSAARPGKPSPGKPNLGRLEKIDPSEYWQAEVANFTAWLSQPDNLHLLGESIGIELSLILDGSQSEDLPVEILVCREEHTEQWVLVLSQLNPSDAYHLGQLLTYAADIEAGTVIWIASQFCIDHHATLDWLNRCAPEVKFCSLEIELWKIGTDAMAARFNAAHAIPPKRDTFLPLKALDNAAPKLELETVSPEPEPKLESEPEPAPEPLTKAEQQNLAFWTALCDGLEQRGSIVKPSTPAPEEKMSFAIGRAGFRLYANYERALQTLWVALEMNDEEAKSYFELLKQQRESIEAELGCSLDWHETLDTKCWSIATALTEVELERGEEWTIWIEWLCETLERFHMTLRDRVKNLRAYDYHPTPPPSLDPLRNVLILPG